MRHLLGSLNEALIFVPENDCSNLLIIIANLYLDVAMCDLIDLAGIYYLGFFCIANQHGFNFQDKINHYYHYCVNILYDRCIH